MINKAINLNHLGSHFEVEQDNYNDEDNNKLKLKGKIMREREKLNSEKHYTRADVPIMLSRQLSVAANKISLFSSRIHNNKDNNFVSLPSFSDEIEQSSLSTPDNPQGREISLNKIISQFYELWPIYPTELFKEESTELGSLETFYQKRDLEQGKDNDRQDAVVLQTRYKDLKSYNEIESLGSIWRALLRKMVLLRRDKINYLRLTRGMQVFAQFLTGYESYVISEVLRSFEEFNNQNEEEDILLLAFQNRNVSRIFVQQLLRFDWFWHINMQFRYSRLFEILGTVPIISWYIPFAFPVSENFPNTRSFVVNSFLRQLFGRSSWLARVFSSGRQSLVTDSPNVASQNLAFEGNGFETANRNKYGTYLGRKATNEFRRQNRLPVDESIVRSFIGQPVPTLVNNGIEHTVRQLARHWHNMLYQPYGNFGHQRGEQLFPFEFLRFHMPALLTVLAASRNVTQWDRDVLGPFIRKLQNIKPVDDVKSTRDLIKEFERDIILNVCGGITSRVNSVRSLCEAIDLALIGVEAQANFVKNILDSTVIEGIAFGLELIESTDWRVPYNKTLNNAVYNVCMGKEGPKDVDSNTVRRTLNLLSSKDKRTLIELCKAGLNLSKPAVLLITRTVTLLQRELRRDALDGRIRLLSIGDNIDIDDCKLKQVYWLKMNDNTFFTYVFLGKVEETGAYTFINRATRHEIVIHDKKSVFVSKYIGGAESLIRAQKAFMIIELEHQKKFSISTYAEFTWMRRTLRNLVIICELSCYELDDARLNILTSLQTAALTDVTVERLEPKNTYYYYDQNRCLPFECTKKYCPNDWNFEIIKTKRIVTCPPQNVIVIGGGPTGLLTAIHCCENVISTGGSIKLWESRDAFIKAGSTFERSQIVRLDARWIAMLRYHLGTIYEDVFVPASCETTSHYGNILPPLGFIEITIKDLENMLNLQVAKLASRELLEHISNSGASYNPSKRQITKLGKALHKGDIIMRNIDPHGQPSKEVFPWKISDVVYPKVLSAPDLVLGIEYSVFVTSQRKVERFRLVEINIDIRQYAFKSLYPNKVDDFVADWGKLPSIYEAGTVVHSSFEALIVESVHENSENKCCQDTLLYSKIENSEFVIDIGQCHIAEAIGKQHGSPVHFEVTTEEPYGVCCLSGLKVSWGMHNFGTRRWTTGVVDDARSHADQNTRVIGDFTKIVNSTKIAKNMNEFLLHDKDWKLHFEKLVKDIGYDDSYVQKIWSLLCDETLVYRQSGPYRRSYLNTRFFETGDNFYLGMEFTREYDDWKGQAIKKLVEPVATESSAVKEKKQLNTLKATLGAHIDRLWYDATLETIRGGDVYNPGGKSKVPRLFLIDSLTYVKLSMISMGETFLIDSDLNMRYDVMFHHNGKVVVRNHEGYITQMSYGTIVRRGGNLTRGPDGVEESKVAIATFPVAHYVNHRAMRLNGSILPYTYVPIGDELVSPHFLRYSGLTGAGINTMLFNNFLGKALDNIPFETRFAEYCSEINWSNGEVIQRGTGSNYGEDGFLRPGFLYEEGMSYLYSKVVEHLESKQDIRNVLSRDWKIKFASSWIPRGMEFHENFLLSLSSKLIDAILEQFIIGVKNDKDITTENAVEILKAILKSKTSKRELLDQEHSSAFLKILNDSIIESPLFTTNEKIKLERYHLTIGVSLYLTSIQVIDYARKAHEKNQRIAGQVYNQHRSVDSIYDDFASEAQSWVAAFSHVATLTSLALALQYYSPIYSIVVTSITLWISTGAVSNTSSYKNRNEAWRLRFADERYILVLKAAYDRLKKVQRVSIPIESNPYFIMLELKKKMFVDNVKYYNYPEPEEFLLLYAKLIENLHDVAFIKHFTNIITSKLLPDDYHVNSYLQEYLIEFYKILQQLLATEVKIENISPTEASAAIILFQRLVVFKTKLDLSIDRGRIRFGFIQERAFKHSQLATLVHWVWANFWCRRLKPTGIMPLPQNVEEVKKQTSVVKPIVVETEEIIAEMKFLQEMNPIPEFYRAILDTESMYYATKESQFTSFIIITGVISFCVGLFFTVMNIIIANDFIDYGLRSKVTLAASFSFGTVSAISSIVLSMLLFRFMRHQFLCTSALDNVIKTTSDSDNLYHLNLIKQISIYQGMVSLLRLFAALASASALSWELFVILLMYPQENHPLFLALAAATLNIVNVFLLYCIDWFLLFYLDPKLGQFICVPFNKHLQEIKESLDVPRHDLETHQMQEQVMWEYVAQAFLHKYRFDTIFLPNRFGSILQYIQSGIEDSYDSIPGQSDKANVISHPSSLIS